MKTSNSFIPSMMVVVGAIALTCLYLTAAGEDAEQTSEGPVKLKTQAAYSPFGSIRKAEKQASIESVQTAQMTVTVDAKDAEETFTEQPLDQEALATFALSVTEDDPRAPPIGRSQPYQGPSQQVLDDPQLYAEFESNQRRTTLQQFVTAATAKVRKLESLIAKGKARGISEEKLEEGLAKLAALKQGIKEVEREL